LRDVAAPVRLAKVAREAPGGERRIDFEDASEDGIAQWRGRTTALGSALARRFGNRRAQVREQVLKMVLLARLSGVVFGPLLSVCFAWW